MDCIACQAPLSMGFPRQEYCSGLPLPSPGDLPDPGFKPASPALAGRFLITEPLGKPLTVIVRDRRPGGETALPGSHWGSRLIITLHRQCATSKLSWGLPFRFSWGRSEPGPDHKWFPSHPSASLVPELSDILCVPQKRRWICPTTGSL